MRRRSDFLQLFMDNYCSTGPRSKISRFQIMDQAGKFDPKILLRIRYARSILDQNRLFKRYHTSNTRECSLIMQAQAFISCATFFLREESSPSG